MKSLIMGAVLICSIVVGTANAAVVTYTLDSVTLESGASLTGSFDWTYDPEEFENGVGVFTSLNLPYVPNGVTQPVMDDPNITITLENNQIEISGDFSFHDYGIDVIMKLVQPLSPTQPSAIDLTNSKYECCGNGFSTYPFASGTIVPAAVPIPAAVWLFGSALLGLGAIKRRKAA